MTDISRMIFAILLQVFMFVGYLLGKEIAVQEYEIKLKQKQLDLIKEFLRKKENKE